MYTESIKPSEAETEEEKMEHCILITRILKWLVKHTCTFVIISHSEEWEDLVVTLDPEYTPATSCEKYRKVRRALLRSDCSFRTLL